MIADGMRYVRDISDCIGGICVNMQRMLCHVEGMYPASPLKGATPATTGKQNPAKESLADLRRRIDTLENLISKLSAAVVRIPHQPRPRDHPAGDPRQRPRPDRRPLRLITTIDDAGQPQAAAGLRHCRVDRRRAKWEWPRGPTDFGCSPTARTSKRASRGAATT